MKKLYFFITLFFTSYILSGQTSWKGTTSTSWNTAANWTAGVPTSTIDAIIGDANFTGVNQPTISATATCKSLTLGGSVSTLLTIGKTTTVSGTLTINANATINHGAASLTVTGNWIKNGTYNATSTSTSVIFAGTAQSIGGSSITNFRKLTINAGSVTTLNSDVEVSGISSICTVKGTLNPNESPVRLLTASNITVSLNGVLKVTGSVFSDNYIISGVITLGTGSIVNYSATALNQTVSSDYTYSTLTISGSGVKSLASNLPVLLSSSSSVGKILVTSGTFDLSSYTANRGTTVAGGTMSVSNGAFLKIGGTGTFPANYTTNTLSLTSTVEYYGTDQTLSAKTYGNLKVSSAAGAVIKTFPSAAFTIAGNFTSTASPGLSVSSMAASNITIKGRVDIGTMTTFNASSYAISVTGNWTNNGTLIGGSSTITMNGAGAVISGAGIHNYNSLTITGSGISSSATLLTLSGNLTTSGSGTFTHATGCTFVMSGVSKTISGSNIILENLTVTGTVSTTASFTVKGDVSVTGSFTQTAGAVSMTGASKTLTGTGAITFKTLRITGTVTTSANFSVSTSLVITGAFTGVSGTTTFTGSSSLTGTANLYNVTINGTTLILSAGSVLGIAGTFTISAGTLNVTSGVPNTVHFNGTGTQSINSITYNRLTVSNSTDKTAAGNITVNGHFTIATGAAFNAGSYTLTLLGNWINNGSFNAGTGTVRLSGAAASAVTGATVFNILTVTKSTATVTVTLQSPVTVGTLNATTGNINTGINILTITVTRAGTGTILGTITRTHAFTTGVAYAFEGPANTILFTAVSGVTSVTVQVASGILADFPNGGAINREYTISVPAGTYTATLRLHYQDAELNGSSESVIQLWHYTGSAWLLSGKTANNSTSNYVEQSGLTNITNRWSCSDDPAVIHWNGSTSSAWHTAANWTPAIVPTAADIAQIGTSVFSNQPVISTAVVVKGIYFGSAQAATLTVTSGGNLTSNGNIRGTWSTNTNHSINTGNQNLTVNGDVILSDGTSGHVINLLADNATITINGSLTESGGANINFSGNTSLTIQNDFNYSSGTFTAGTGTVTYNGTGSQVAAAVSYNNLTIAKSAGVAAINGAASIGGNLVVSGAELDFNASSAVTGNISVSAGATLQGNAITINTQGNWTIAGNFVAGSGSVVLSGSGMQTISSCAFNDLAINKASGTAALSGNITVSGNLSVQSGEFDLGTYTANRDAEGGQFYLGDAATLSVAGTDNFPHNFSDNVLGVTSTVHYNGTVLQSVSGITYGHLRFSNGSTNAKTLTGTLSVNGDITLNSGATVDAGAYTINLLGSWLNSGVFIPSSGSVLLNGTGKTVSGNTTFNNLTVNGSYTVDGSDITYNGLILVTPSGSYAAGSGTATINGDLTNSGILTSAGTTTFTGTTVQNIHLINALASTSTGIVNFNGNVSPVLNSTSTPTFANLNINNTAGVNPSVNWLIVVSMTIGSGGVFNGGSSTHTIMGSFTNNGTVTSNGTLNFAPASTATIKLAGTVFSSTGTVIFAGAGQTTITGTPTALNEVRITNTNVAGITAPSGWTMTGNFIIASNALFKAGSYTHTVNGDIESNGTLDGGTSTFIMNSANGLLTGSPNTTFNHFTVQGSIASNSDFNVAGDFSNNGTYDGSIGTLIMTGSNPATIGGTTNPSAIAQLTIAKTGASTLVSMTGNISNIFTLYINSGTLFTANNGITQDAGGGILMISNGATLRLGGNNSLPGFSAYGFDIFSTVDYAGTNQIVGNAASYGNLMITAAGMKVATVPLIVQNDFTLSAGTFNAAVSVTHAIGGNWTMTGGTFSNASSTMLFNGTGAQYISSTGAFNNLTVNKSAGLVHLSGAVTVNSVLNFIAGKISMGNNNLIIGNAGSITGANLNNYVIAAGTGTLNQRVTAGSNKSFPVGLTTAYTPATIALTGGSATDIFALRMLPAAYENGTSGTVIAVNAVKATWMISESTPGGSDATVSLQWPLSLEAAGFNRNFSRLAHFSGGYWDYGISDIPASGANPYSVSRAGFTSFSPFMVSQFDPLPVTWLSISGNHKNDDNIIYWSTAAELNNDYFGIEASTDGTNFREIGRLGGYGNTTITQNYSFLHENAAATLYYYRVRQVDFDNKYSYSPVIKLMAETKSINSLSLSPNPVEGQAMISLLADKATNATLSITDINGKIVFRKTQVLVKGINAIPIDLSGKAAGVYFLTITNNSTGAFETIRFINK